MRTRLLFALAALALAGPAVAQDIRFQGASGGGGGAATSITPGSTTVTGVTNCFGFVDASNLFQCDNTLASLDNSGTGNGVFKLTKSPSGGSATSNFLSLAGTTPTTLSAFFTAVDIEITGAGTSSQINRAATINHLGGYTGSSTTQGLVVQELNAGTGVTPLSSVGNFAVYGRAAGAGTGFNIGIFGNATGGARNFGGYFLTGTSSAGNINIAVAGISFNGAGKRIGGYFGAGNPDTTTLISSALTVDNSSDADPLIIAQDNGAALPTTGPTATWQIMDGAWPQVGNAVLTSGTATAETQARATGDLVHSCTWTNAQVVALGAVTAGDISCFTLPAKTEVRNVYLIITGQGAGTTTLTAAVGRVSAGYIDYVVASDAKAAANTVYGDASGERGTNLVGYDLPSYTTTTAVNIHFISTGANLSSVTGSTGRVIIETALVP